MFKLCELLYSFLKVILVLLLYQYFYTLLDTSELHRIFDNSSPKMKLSGLPCMEEAGHELCFISHPKARKEISCDIFGKLQMYRTQNGWEVWRFIKDKDSGNFIITSWTHTHKVLSSNRDGGVHTTENKDGSWEKWKISLHPNSRGLRIQSAEHGRSLVFNGHKLSTTDKDCEDTACWHLEPAHRNQFFISVISHDKRLSSTLNDPFTHHNRKSWEKWIVEPRNDHAGQFIIQSLEHGKYLGSCEDGSLVVGESPHYWTFCTSTHGGVFIQSVEYSGKLSCDKDGRLYTTSEDSGCCESWTLEPIMPATINGKQIWSLVGTGVATITLAIAAPFAVMGAVGVMGFGVEGIVAGSTAAGMMSTSAIASGGGVVVGGTVATLQSIGAAGLSAAGASAAVGAGAVAGGMASLGVVAVTNGLATNEGEIKLNETKRHLPLCSWRLWS